MDWLDKHWFMVIVFVLVAAFVIGLMTSGCGKTVARVEDGVMTITRTRFFIQEDIGCVSYDATDGSFVIEGYKSDMTRALELVKYFSKLAEEEKKEKMR